MSDPSPHTSTSRTPLLVGAVALAAVVAVVAVVLVTGGDDDESASGCVADLMARVPEDARFIEGGDLAAARDRGYDDSTVESLAETSAATGVYPDPLTRRVVLVNFDPDTDAMPFDPADVECWVGVQNEFVARGDFDPERVRSSRYGEGLELSADDDLVASERVWLSEPVDDDDAGPDGLSDAFEALDGDGVVSFALAPGRVDGEEDRSWIGVGLVPEEDDDWGLSAVWSFRDDATAEDGEAPLRELLSERSVLAELVAGDPGDDLERVGATLHLRSTLTADRQQWMAAFQRIDPALTFDPYAEPDGDE